MRDLGESVKDEIFKRSGRYLPREASNETYNERISPARAALMRGETDTTAAALDRAVDLVVEQIESDDDARARMGRPQLSPAARRLRGV